jgi:hypothetical protein
MRASGDNGDNDDVGASINPLADALFDEIELLRTMVRSITL